MTFIPGNFAKPQEDVLEKIENIKGEISEKESRLLAAELLRSQPGILYKFLTGESLFEFQIIKCKMFSARDACLDISGRGGAKSFTAAVWALIYAILHPGIKILIAAPSLRQSSIILGYIEEIRKKEGAVLLRQFLGDNCYKRRPEKHEIQVGTSSIFAMSLGDGKKIRGARAQVLIVDEAFAVPEDVLNAVIGPMMVVHGNVAEIKETREKEDKLIAKGLMQESDRQVFAKNKVIMLSSADYEFGHLYKRFDNYIKKITDPEFMDSEEYEEAGRSYGIINLGWEAIPEELLDRGYIKEQRGLMSEDLFRREYEAQFTPESDSYYKMSKMLECSLKVGEYPTVELTGDKKEQYAYILGIDPNFNNSEGSDHFAMCLIKVDKDHLNIGYVVHNYAVSGFDLSSHMTYLLYLVTHFNIEYICLDATSGGARIIESCNNSSLFKSRNLELKSFEPNFDDEKGIKETKFDYDLSDKKIVHPQVFGSKWNRDANIHLQMCFDHKKIRFASTPIDSDLDFLKKADIPIGDLDFRLDLNEDLKGLQSKDKNRAKQHQFVEHQSVLIDLTRRECGNIQITQSQQGTQSFDLPPAMKKQSGPTKTRKDSYSALLLAAWGAKCYEILANTEAKKHNPWEDFRAEML